MGVGVGLIVGILLLNCTEEENMSGVEENIGVEENGMRKSVVIVVAKSIVSESSGVI